MDERNKNDWEIDELVDYIVNTHHTYIRRALPEINNLTAELINKYPYIYEIKQINEKNFKLNEDLMIHIMREERAVFPHFKKLLSAKKQTGELELRIYGEFKSVSVPIESMENEHKNLSTLVKIIEDLIKSLVLANTHIVELKTLYQKFAKFKNDLDLHFHIESNILFPRAEELEKQLKITFI